MKRDVGAILPQTIRQALKKFGEDIRIARLKRDLTIEEMAGCIGVHRATYSKMEFGDPMVGVGLYAAALFILGFGTPLVDLADPRNDETGLRLDLERLPKRARGRMGTERRFLPARLDGRARTRTREGVLRIGVLGAMSGPAAKWGLVNKHCALATAEMYNERGGVDIEGEKFRIEIVDFDDRLDADLAAAGAGLLIRKGGIRYVIGPNVEHTVASVIPIAEDNNAMLFPYSYTRTMYAPPHQNAVLGQVPGFKAGPVIYQYLRDNMGVKRLSVLAPDTVEGLRQRDETVAAAERLRLGTLAVDCTYRSGASNVSSEVARTIEGKPDLVVLPNLAPEDAPTLISTARRLGYRGILATEAAQDINILNRRAGAAANGFVVLGGASTAVTRSPYMDEFIRRYVGLAGEWNDEAGTKVYALEMILATLRRAGKRALDNVDRFKTTIPGFVMRNPFVKDNRPLRYVGSGHFRQKRQIGVPLIVNTIEQGRFVPLFIGQAE